MRSLINKIFQQEDLNFLLTNRIPRIFLTRLMGRLSKLENPLFTRLGIAVWQVFADLDLSEAKRTQFASLHDCFTRELKPNARPIDTRPTIVTSPCDAIIGAFGTVQSGELFQAKGYPYRLEDLLPDPEWAARYHNSKYVTLRLTSSMYHRFHAPYDCKINKVTYISGDTWNVNPITLKRVEKLFCKNERAVIHACLLPGQQPITLVAVAAILVASIKLHALDKVLNLDYKGATELPSDHHYAKGDELGWFEHGSTIILFAPDDFNFACTVQTDVRIAMGQALLELP